MHSFETFETDERVVVATPVDEEDRRYAWRRGVFVRYSNPQWFAQRFAVVILDRDDDGGARPLIGHKTVYLRPESLARELHTKDEQS